MYDYITTDSKTWFNLKERAKENRQNPTYAEKIMWYLLKSMNQGVKFRRQQIIGNYIVDFISLPIKLIIELDGDSHIGKEEYDSDRQAYLELLGYRVIRFTNNELLENGNIVEKRIKKEISNLLNPS